MTRRNGDDDTPPVRRVTRDTPPAVPLRRRSEGAAGARRSDPKADPRADVRVGSRADAKAEPRAGGDRRNRLAEARRYHPRGRTIGEAMPPDTQSKQGKVGPPSTTSTQSKRSKQSTPSTPSTASTQSRRGEQSARERPALRLVRGEHDVAPIRPTRRRQVTRTRPGTHAGLADSVRRLRFSTALIFALFLVIAGRLVLIQLTDAPAWAQEGLAARTETIDLPAPRGDIVDRDGALLAGSVEARYVFADPGLVQDPGKTADALVGVLGIPRSELLPKLVPHKRDDGTVVRFEYLVRGIPPATGQAVSRLNLAGIGVVRDEGRVVPGHDLAANLIGFTNRDLTGLAGLEAAYDDVLRGVNGQRRFEVGQPEGPVNLDHEIPGGFREETPARPGSSLRLTIDRDLQFEILRILGATMTAQRATVAAAVVLDVRTGEVLAQASYPSYDAADPFKSAVADRGDVATGLAVEPGSVHKGIVFAACLQEGVVNPSSVIAVPRTIRKGTETYDDTHPHRSNVDMMTLPGILAYSSNVGTIELADKIGAQKLYEYQRAFGLGESTGEGLPGESSGLVQPPKNWSAESHGSIPIGHGVSVTPLQMAAVYATIANGGTYIRPTLVKSVIAPDGTETPTPAAPTRRVISAENALALRTMLEAVVTVDDATGRRAAVPGYRVAGKTGTGRLIRNGRPVAGEVASFVGMAPADAPRYVIAVFAHTPGGNGGAVSAVPFAQMMQFTLVHYRVAPTGSRPPPFRVYQ